MIKFKFMISKICYNPTDLIACELNNIDSGQSKILIWFVKNSRPEMSVVQIYIQQRER